MNLGKLLVATAAALMIGTAAHAAEIPPDVRVNGKFIEPVAYIEDDRTYIPVRFVSEALGYTVDWEEDKVIIGKTLVVEDFVLKGDRAFVPLRFVSENLGAEVTWDEELYIADVKTYESSFDDSLFWLSRIISAESAGEPLEGRVAVGNVVLNRVESKDYPNTVREVVFDRKGGVQFTPVANGTINNSPTRGSVLAAKLAVRGESYAGDSLFFMNPRISTSSWISKNRKFFASINNHDFYL